MNTLESFKTFLIIEDIASFICEKLGRQYWKFLVNLGINLVSLIRVDGNKSEKELLRSLTFKLVLF